jgi:mannose-1-phosphate guanylyltransferase/mannose-6-phosphate isomerase
LIQRVRQEVIDYGPPSVKVEKPWGSFEQYTHTLPSTVKVITVAPGGVLSRQYHHKRDELWVVLDFGACVELDGRVLHPGPGEKLFVPRGTVHRLSSVGEGEARVLEISFGHFDEDDIVRLDDVYGRSGSYNDGEDPSGPLQVGDERPRKGVGI